MSVMGSSYLSSPDEPSRVYPERLIRPLPRRSIKSRLSQEAAEAISYPPKPPSTSLPAYSHYVIEEYEHEHDPYQDDEDHDHDCQHHHHHCHHHEEDDDDIESADDPSPISQRHFNVNRAAPRSPRSIRHGRYGSHGGKNAVNPDSYEAFENTNNKKKRKIPTSGSLNLHQSSLNSDMANVNLDNTREGGMDEGLYGPSTSPSSYAAQGHSRSRSSRKAAPRNPLGVSVNGSNVRNGPSAYEHSLSLHSSDDPKTDQGIISKAIANATTLLKNPLGKGQENMGVLDSQAKSTPTNSQFTFTCETDAKGVKFPEQSLYSPDYAQRMNSSSAAGIGTLNRTSNSGANLQHSPAAQQSINAASAGANHQKARPRRRKGDVYALAARQRKLQQEYSNLQHPPSPDDIWICEFCEYESIFGAPPHALVRQYEIKDRRERKRLAEKRRLLEKAKLKGRKGKKQTKNATKAANNANQQPLNQQAYDQQPLDQMDEYLDDGYDDDPIQMPMPPPQAPLQQPMPGTYGSGKGGGGITASGTNAGGGGRGGGGAVQ